MSETVSEQVNERILGNNQLPIANHRAEIEDAVSENAVTILTAPTGSGKTTQVPQYIHEMQIADDIVVTQPRIVAARSVSERINHEIDASGYGECSVGYYTSKEGTARPQRDQHIALLTDGKAAAQLLYESKEGTDSDRKKVLIIDEVHERNQNIDLLLAIAKQKTDPASKMYDPNLKVVIMSATVDSRRLQEYFSHTEPPIIEVEVPTYPIKRMVTNRSVANVALKSAISTSKTALVFLPGKREIEQTNDAIERKQQDSQIKRPVIPLHGQQNSSSQKSAFRSYRYGAMVLATNAAQTSITIPGVKTVVDSGKVRNSHVRYDILPSGTDGLYLEDASQADLLQRMGRTGRTEPGWYILASSDGVNPPVPLEDRQKYSTPSIKADRIDDMLLTIKATGHDLTDFSFLDKPPHESVKAATDRLYKVGALDKWGNITARGRLMNELPIDIEYSAMIVFAQEKNYSQEVVRNLVDIASVMQVGGIFKRSPRKQEWRDLLESSPSGEAKENESDFFAQLEAYVKLRKMNVSGSLDGFDVNSYAFGLVEKNRQSLARKLGIDLSEPTIVDSNDRQTVLTCINAGQINQIWRKKGDKWTSFLESSPSFKLSDSSVAGRMGSLVTGRLFTLGFNTDDQKNTIEDVNNVPNIQSLELAAGHLVSERIDRHSTEYDAESGKFTALVEKRLGDFVLRTERMVVSHQDAQMELDVIQKAHKKNEFEKFIKDEEPAKPYSIDEVSIRISDPECIQYGVDIVTGEPLLAWRGGKGKWHSSKEVALVSLEARMKYFKAAPAKNETRELKVVAKRLFPDVNKIKKGDSEFSEEAKALIRSRRKMPTEDWILEAERLIKKTNS